MPYKQIRKYTDQTPVTSTKTHCLLKCQVRVTRENFFVGVSKAKNRNTSNTLRKMFQPGDGEVKQVLLEARELANYIILPEIDKLTWESIFEYLPHNQTYTTNTHNEKHKVSKAARKATQQTVKDPWFQDQLLWSVLANRPPKAQQKAQPPTKNLVPAIFSVQIYAHLGDCDDPPGHSSHQEQQARDIPKGWC